VVGVSELRSAVDELAAVDLTELSGAELLSWVVECSGAVNRLQAQLARGVRAAEAADAHAAAFADGEVTAQHVRVVSGAVTPERVARAAAMGVDPGETDRILTSLAVQTVPEVTAKAARRWVSGWIPTVHWTPPTCAAG
jgi:nucleoid-associated protein YgaU